MRVHTPQLIKELLTNNKSSWINNIDELDYDVIETITQIQNWLVNNKPTRTYARFLERFCRNKEFSLKQYLALAWSILFFDGCKLKEDIIIELPKTYNTTEKNWNLKRNEFKLTLNKIYSRHTWSRMEQEELKELLNTLISKDAINMLCYYGTSKKEWNVNNYNYDLIKRYNIKTMAVN